MPWRSQYLHMVKDTQGHVQEKEHPCLGVNKCAYLTAFPQLACSKSLNVNARKLLEVGLDIFAALMELNSQRSENIY